MVVRGRPAQPNEIKCVGVAVRTLAVPPRSFADRGADLSFGVAENGRRSSLH